MQNKYNKTQNNHREAQIYYIMKNYYNNCKSDNKRWCMNDLCK